MGHSDPNSVWLEAWRLWRSPLSLQLLQALGMLHGSLKHFEGAWSKGSIEISEGGIRKGISSHEDHGHPFLEGLDVDAVVAGH